MKRSIAAYILSMYGFRQAWIIWLWKSWSSSEKFVNSRFSKVLWNLIARLRSLGMSTVPFCLAQI